MGLAVRVPRQGTASCCESETRHKKGGVPIRCPANCREEVQIPRLTKKFAEHGRGWNFTNEEVENDDGYFHPENPHGAPVPG